MVQYFAVPDPSAPATKALIALRTLQIAFLRGWSVTTVFRLGRRVIESESEHNSAAAIPLVAGIKK